MPIHIVTFPTALHTEVTTQSDIVYSEVVREGVRKFQAHVEEIATGGPPPTAVNIDKLQEDVIKLWNTVKPQPEISQEQKNRIKVVWSDLSAKARRRKLIALCVALAVPPPNSCTCMWSFRRHWPTIPYFISSASPLAHGNIPATSRVSISTPSTKLRCPVPPSKTRMRFSLVLERARLELKLSKVSSLAGRPCRHHDLALQPQNSRILPGHFPDAW
jgi:hypothetical protein